MTFWVIGANWGDLLGIQTRLLGALLLLIEIQLLLIVQCAVSRIGTRTIVTVGSIARWRIIEGRDAIDAGQWHRGVSIVTIATIAQAVIGAEKRARRRRYGWSDAKRDREAVSAAAITAITPNFDLQATKLGLGRAEIAEANGRNQCHSRRTISIGGPTSSTP